MKTSGKLNYLLILLLLLISFNISSQINNQEEFTSFLKEAELPSCFNNMDYHHVDELFKYGKTRFESFDISSNYDKEAEVFKLNTRENCHDTKSVQLKYVDYLSGEFIFLYHERAEGNESFGSVVLYEFQDSTWTEGKEIKISWSQLFNIEEKELKELRELDQFPRCKMTFQKTGMRVEIPWKLYTYGEGSESNGYVQGGGKQPIILKYSTFL